MCQLEQIIYGSRHILNKRTFFGQVLSSLSFAPWSDQERCNPLGNTGITAQFLKPSQVLFRVNCLIDKSLTLVIVVSEHIEVMELKR